MRYLPVFFEATPNLESSRLEIVRQVRLSLFARGFTALPNARTIWVLRDVLANIQAMGDKPMLFVLNTLGAEALLPEIDKLMGDTPALFFRHKQVWMKEQLPLLETIYGVTTRVGKLRPRLCVTRRYSALNSAQVARALAPQIEAYLRFGDFRSLETELKAEHRAFYDSRTA